MSKYWKEGYDVGRASGGDNPYTAGSFEYEQWQKGYEEGVRRRMQME